MTERPPSSGRLRVQVVQPVVAQYRRPFFEALMRRPELDLTVDASPRSPGTPASVRCGPGIDTGHACTEWFGGRLMWQRALRLRDDLGAGDVLVITGNPRFLSNLPLVARARHRGVGVAWWGHGWSATSRPWRAALRTRLMHMADTLVLYTDSERDSFVSRGWSAERVFALNNALDQAEIRLASAAWPAERLAAFRDAQRLAQSPLLLFCGRLRETPSTDLDVVLQALALLRGAGLDCQLAVIGDGPSGPALRQLAKALGVDDRVRWLGAVYDEDSVAPWFLSARCFVYPGAIGLSLLQAFGYGLPVVTHDRLQEHNPEIAALENGGNGLLFPRGDARALACRLAQLCTDDALRQRLSARALETVTRTYTMDNMVARFVGAMHGTARLCRRREVTVPAAR